MQFTTAETVYKNVIRMLDYRKTKLVGKIDNDVINTFKHGDYTQVVAKNLGVLTCIIIISPGKDIVTASFKKIHAYIQRIMDQHKDCSTTYALIVSDTVLSSHVKKYIATVNAEKKNLHITQASYGIFMSESPLHPCVPKHEIMSVEDVQRLCDTYYTNQRNFPKILQTDPQAIWIGAKPGDVIRITRSSDTAGITISYRYCVPSE